MQYWDGQESLSGQMDSRGEVSDSASSIGVFDSGIGGLTVVKELSRHLPYENIVYFGDTARLPYGIKSKEAIIRFSLENVLFLLRQNVKLIVIACNTSSSIALPELQKHFNLPIIGVLQPGIKRALIETKTRCIGVIGTRATIRSHAYEDKLKALDPFVKVISKECPLFVPLVEEGWANTRVTLDIALHYLASFKNNNVDTLILGCTHYPLLKSAIQKVLGKGVTLIDSAKQVALEVSDILKAKGILNKNRHPEYSFYVSDTLTNFSILGKRFLGKNLKNVKIV